MGGCSDEVSRLLSTFPTQVDCKETEYFPNVRVFWSQNPSFSSSDDAFYAVKEKIKSAFCKIDLSHLDGLIQFWAPLQGGRLLSTCYQPFVLEHFDSCFDIYRRCCMTYQYSIIDDHDDDDDDDFVAGINEEDPMVISGPPADVFLNHLPVVVNLRVQQGSPLVLSALECGLKFSLLLPVFYHSPLNYSSYSSCVGVIECSMKKRSTFLEIFNKLKTALERVGLSTFVVQETLPYKSICGLKPATAEIEDALEIVCESHYPTLVQVWIASDSNYHLPFSSSLEGTQTTRRFAVKLIGSCVGSDHHHHPLSVIEDYHEICDVLPLNMGVGLPGKTLETYQQHFCRNVSELSDNGLLGLLPDAVECSCLVICLKSSHTGDDVDFAFEFLWPHRRSYLILLESLLLTLKRCLPSFRFASGPQLGDQLRVLDVDNSTGTGIGFFKILETNKISPIPKALEEIRISVAEDCVSSSEVKFNRVTGKQITISSNFARRELSDLCLCESPTVSSPEDIRPDQGNLIDSCESQSESIPLSQEHPTSKNSIMRQFSDMRKGEVCWVLLDSSHEDSSANQEHSASSISVRCPGNHGLVIKVGYGDHRTLSYLPISSRLADIQKMVEDKYNLDPGSYTLQFLDYVDEWLRLVDEQDWESCLIHWRTTKSQAIRLRVLPCANLMNFDRANQEHSASSNTVKRKLTDLYESQIESSQEDTRANQEHPVRSNCIKKKLNDQFGSLLLKLKRCFLNFKFCAGAQLGNHLRILDVESPTDTGIGFFEAHEENEISPVPKESESKMTPIPLPREDVKQQSGRRMKKASKNLTDSVCTLNSKDSEIGISEWEGPSFVMRKLTDLYESETDSNLKDNTSNQEDSASSKRLKYSGNKLIVSALYGDNQSLFYLPLSSKFADIKKYILSPGSYELQFLDFEDQWVSLDDDRDWESCTKSWTTAGTETIRLLVLLRQTKD